MAGLDDWQPAAPEGHRLLAAAPLTGDWGWPVLPPVAIGAFGGLNPLLWTAPPYGVGVYCALLVGLAAYVVRWRRAHPHPSGMAAALDVPRRTGPVVVVTDSAVLMAAMKASRYDGRATATGPGSAVRGLVGIEAVGERLVLSFADGSTASMRQRVRTKGAAARVAALAAPVLGSRNAPLAPERSPLA